MQNLNKTYNRVNNILGWFFGIFASVIYIITSEPTVSFWDCGEYISTAYKLLVGHPPGAPLFQIIGRFFSLFAMGDVTKVARMVNSMTAVASGFTIMFLFWSITMLAKKLVLARGEMSVGKSWAIFGSGFVGAMAYTFTDSFWFSAVEGEVYGMSSFFTAIVFWAILKWDEDADNERSWRWLLLISYMIGLSVGVHLLNLLTIPAMVFVFYFKKYKTISWKGMLIAGLVSIVLLAFVMNGVIPWIVKLAGYSELFFINVLGLPFNFGTIIYFMLLIGGILYGLYFSKKKGKVMLNTIILAFTFLLIGYSSFVMLVIRSNADPTIDENNPDNAINLLAYLQREQYGDWPIGYGQYYNAPVVGRADGNPVYAKDVKTGKYEIIDAQKGVKPEYDSRFMTIFPRMWSNSQAEHEQAYKNWTNLTGTPIETQGQDGQPKTINKPSFGENLTFFFNYQLNFMYWRYFMWNFVGKQDDNQGMGRTENKSGDLLHGNWISGFNSLDAGRLGPQDRIPESLKNKGRNKFYFLPLLLGLIGLIYHGKYHYKDTIVVGFLFFMTGFAIVLYLNQYAPQPRERDYSYAASFYAFAIWIGLGVLALVSFLEKYLKKVDLRITSVLVTLLCTIAVPGVLAKDGWDDHDRSGRYTVLDIANNYLNSCAKNAILFTNGDNDTFPVWYAQEVEGTRTDVRVCNLSLLQTDWYIDQMKRKAYLSDPVPFSLPREKYRQGSLDLVYFIENPDVVDTSRYYNLEDLIKFVASDNPNTKFQSQIGLLDYFPTKKFKIPVDKEKVIANGTVAPELADQVAPAIEWKLNREGIQKNQLMVLDLLAHFKWDRPIYFAMTIGDENYLDLKDYFQQEGLAYRLVPIRTNSLEGDGRINTRIMYDNLMNKFKLNMQDPNVYFNEDHLRMTVSLRNIYGRLANALITEGKNDSALAVCDRCIQLMPDKIVPYNYFTLGVVEAYFRAGAKDKAIGILKRTLALNKQDLSYYFSFPADKTQSLDQQKQMALAIVQRIGQLIERFPDPDVQKESKAIFDKYYSLYTGESGNNRQ
ncbi:MAG: DUF2723 domain-containing protein [Bacteroidota bacterium]